MRRSQRSTKGQLSKYFQDFTLNMPSHTSTPKGKDAQSGSASHNTSMDETTIRNRDQEMIAQLMKRLESLERDNKRTTEMLLDSEAKRVHLQEELSTKVPLPVVNVSTTNTPTSHNNAGLSQNQIVSSSADTIVPSPPQYNLNIGTVPLLTNIGHSRAMNTVTSTTASCQNLYPPERTITSTGRPLPGHQFYSGNTNPYSPTSWGMPACHGYIPTSQPISATQQYISVPPLPNPYVPREMPSHHGFTTNLPPISTTQQYIYASPQPTCTPMPAKMYGATRKLYDLPEFHGHPEQWPVFITAFSESSIAYEYTPLENTFRLQKAIKGEAREEVECLLIDPRNVFQVIEQLKNKYGRPEILIRSQLQKIREILPIQENNLEKIVAFATKVQNLTIFLKSADAVQHLSNPTLMDELMSKMPMSKRIEWATYSSAIVPYPTLEHFNTWINQIAKVIAQVTLNTAMPPIKTQPMPVAIKPHQSQQRTTRAIHTVKEADKEVVAKEIVCLNCKGSHYLSKCDVFLKMSVNDRWSFVKSNRLCFSCLRKGHNLTQCNRKKNCNVDGCKKSHHETLHLKESRNHEQVNLMQPKCGGVKSTKLLFKLLPIELRGPNNKIIQSYAFLDEGSSTTLIEETLACQLGVNTKKQSLTLQWFEGKSTDVLSMSMEVDIKGKSSQMKWCTLKARSVPNLDLPAQSINLKELQSKFHRLKNLPIAEYAHVSPQVLIGLDNCHLIANMKSVHLAKSVIAANTTLGWVIYGKTEANHVISSPRLSVILHSRQIEEQSIHKVVADYFTTENFGVKPIRQPLEAKDVIRARQILKNTTRKVSGGYETGLLWKTDNVQLPDSYKMAINRLQSMEKKMKNDEKFSECYKAAMSNYISNGYARKLSPAEAKITTPHTWYLPHFAVFNVNKPGKCRLVFDAAAAVQGTSLNSVLLKGPDDNQCLFKILHQFREGTIGVCADIKEMFLQVRIRNADQDAQRFLWRFSPDQPVETYVMQAMIFGATSSPCSAQHVKNMNAFTSASDQPEVIDAIVGSHYVDDMVCSFRSKEDAVRITSAVKLTHSQAGFQLRGFLSNSSHVQSRLNENKEDQPPSINMNAIDAVEKILGMYWDSRSDEFVFKLHMHKVDPEITAGTRCPTKRELLCLVMSVYDPFGILANLLIYGKILLQELWRTGTNWDEPISIHIFEHFKQWVPFLEIAKQVRLPRCHCPFLFHEDTNIELHIFNDASQIAFASVAYFRITTLEGTIVSFVTGKTKCAPIKVLSIPRLELQAAILGTRLKQSILESYRIKIARTVLWSDSKTVISWVKSDHRQFKPFVMHRIGEILDSTCENDWRWLPTKMNAADAATRTTYPVAYTANNIWISGPAFLHQDEENWPTQINTNFTTDEEKRNICLTVVKKRLINYSNFSKYPRLVRTIAWLFRFEDITRKTVEYCEFTELTASEVKRGEVALCKIVQAEVYASEISELKEHVTVSSSSHISSLSPGLNADGLICVYGRIDYALAVPEATRHPIILPTHHYVTELLISWYHQKQFHQNDELVVNEIRRKFWVPNLRQAVKKAKSNCQQCKNERVKPKPPMMGQLPIDRLQPYVRPFTYTGLDYFGPIYVTIGRRKEKRWAALFTCLTIRAVHVELAADLSTDACLICIRNFVNRRGVPVKIRSDMGTNFVGADGELRRVSDLFDYNHIQRELATRNITWEFNCPANPSSGGCWERLVKSIKRVLASTLKEVSPQVETLRSLLIEAENVVNSRPLTHLPVTVDNLDPLTPNHFLLGTTNSTQTPGGEEKICCRKQYRISQQLKNKFWRRWIREYLPTLTKRTKWFQPQNPIKIDDLVLICDENLPRSQWKRGIVTSKFPAKDGTTRIVELRTESGTLRRPVSKLAILEVRQ